MKRVLTAVVLIPLVLLVVFRAPLWLFALVVAAVAVLATREYLGILRGYGIEPLQRTTLIMAAIIVLGTLCGVDAHIFVYLPFLWASWLFRAWEILLIFALIFGIPLVFRRDMTGALPAVSGSAFGVLYVSAALSLLVLLRHDWSQNVLIVFVLFSVWAGDTAAYYTGRSIGRLKLAPIVSPKKTWEGAIASVIASVVIAWLVFHFHLEIRSLFSQSYTFYTPIIPASHIAPGHIIAIGVITNVAAQFGDLFESALKRGAHIKDSGSILPGHGGILDRIDALLFAIPVVWYYANLTGFLHL
ncbi:MAG TPA: phosphatidate cytidylyltransferase [Candidatus Angelobacter sp.]|nr:phosphatidate cytidylyltransferase [Candidatus Angelobacter sp.]